MTGHLARAPYWGFSIDHDLEDAKDRYRERFKCEPEEVITEGTALLLGPLPDTDALGRKRDATTSNKPALSSP